MKRGKSRQVVVKNKVWTKTESPLKPYLEFLMDPQDGDKPEVVRTSLCPDKAENLVLMLLRSNGHKMGHRGFIRNIRDAIKEGRPGLNKYVISSESRYPPKDPSEGEVPGDQRAEA